MSEAENQSVAEVRVEAGRTTILELKTEGQALFDSTGSAEISLVDEDENPVTTSPVHLTSENGERAYTIDIDASGRGRIDGVDPGTYILSLEPISAPGVVTPGASTTLTGSYEINLKDSSDVPVTAGPVYLIGETWENIYTIEIDSTGHGALSDIVPGKYTVSLENKVKLENIIKFGPNERTINDKAGKRLDEIFKLIHSRVTENISIIDCIGYASEDGSKSYNYSLSVERGAAARDALIEKFKLNEDSKGIKKLSNRIKSDGGGELPGKLRKEREENRRAEFEIFFR
jgi:outer membrane protein OmpA-like peptidoglycan-associated protein